jgi:hypothetical protein
MSVLLKFALQSFYGDTICDDGTWRSLVARTLGVGEVPSSNLGVPTKSNRAFNDQKLKALLSFIPQTLSVRLHSAFFTANLVSSQNLPSAP